MPLDRGHTGLTKEGKKMKTFEVTYLTTMENGKGIQKSGALLQAKSLSSAKRIIRKDIETSDFYKERNINFIKFYGYCGIYDPA